MLTYIWLKKNMIELKKKNPEHSFNKQQNIHCKELPKHFKLPSMNAYDMPEKNSSQQLKLPL